MSRRIAITLLLAGSLVLSMKTGIAQAQEQPETQFLPSPVREVPLRFEHLSLEDGLSQSSINDILQDRDGFMWFGTGDGLNRYDGHTFTVFKYIPFDSTSLAHNQVNTLLEDQAGALWVGTNQGLHRMDAGTGTFTRYQHDPEDSTSLSSNIIQALYEDQSGVLWVGTNQGLNQMDPETGTFTRYQHDPEDSTSLSHNDVRAIYEDQAGALWIGTRQGLNRLDRDTGAVARYLRRGSEGFDINAFVTGIRDDPNVPNVLWLAGNGLARFDIDTGEVTRYLNEAEEVLQNVVFDFTPDPHRPDVFWVAKGGDGLVRFDTRTKQAKSYRQDPSDPLSLHSNELFSIYTDRSGIVWAGAQSQQGLVKFDPSAGGFIHYRHVPGDPKSLHYGNVWRILEDRDGVLWAVVANESLRTYDRLNRIDRTTGQVTQYFQEPVDILTTNGQIRQLYEDRAGIFWIIFRTLGLKRLDRETGRIVSYQHNPNDPRSLSFNILREMYEDRQGTLWISTLGGGLNRYERATDTFTRYQHDPEDSTSLSSNDLWVMLEDRAGALWVGTRNAGLNRMDRQSGTFTRYAHDPEDSTSLAANFVFQLFEGQEGGLWVVTAGREQGMVLHGFDPDTGAFTRYAHDPDDPTSLSDDGIMGVYERAREPGVLWIATRAGGLNRFDTRTDTFTHYTEQDGLANNFVYDILEDEEGRLWLSTNKGLSCFDPETETFRNYDVADGLQSNEFNGGAAYKSPSGELFFGGINGITAFFPHEVLDNPVPPSVVFTDFKVLNESVAPGPEAPLTEPIARAEEIHLSYWQKSIAFDFVGLHFQHSEKNQYQFKLEGFDDDWMDAGTQRTAAYTNLDPGHYTFRVRAANSDGIWNMAGASVRVVVAPPWWKTWWAYLFYAVTLGAAIVAVDRVQRARLIRKERQWAEIEQAELRAEAAEAQSRALQAENQRKQIELEKSRELEQAYQRLEATHEQLEQSHTIVEAINKETGFTRLLQTLLEEARVIPGVEKATALVYDATLDAFVFRASSGWEVEQLRPIRMTADEAHARYVSHAEEVAEDIFAAKDAAARPGAEHFAELGMAASFLALRVRVEDQVAGYLIFDNMTDRDAFDHRDVALLEGLREHIRSAFIKTRLLDDLHQKNVAISEALDHLQATQAQLIQSEKMASLGQLTAGIAHEIKNPLNFVNNFAQLCTELADELADELDTHHDTLVSEIRDDFKEILADLKRNAIKIEEHGKRADGIVKSMLLHSRGKPGERQAMDVNALLDEYVNLAYHGMRANTPDFNVTLERAYDETVGEVELMPEEISRVFLNLLNNAFYAVHEQALSRDDSYTPTVEVRTRRNGNHVEIEVQDNGPGIAEAVHEKIFEPFFTTKPTGSGTGLGLSISYDIITQGHGGMLTVESTEGHGATFVITLPG